jgi:hypothetical protein
VGRGLGPASNANEFQCSEVSVVACTVQNGQAV